MLELAFLAHNDAVDRVLAAVVRELTAVFPHRILAIYLTGSAVDGTLVAGSDLDLLPIFAGEFVEDEADRCRAWGRSWQGAWPQGAWPLDVEPACLAQLTQTGATGLKQSAVLLAGRDIRGQVPWEPLENFRRDVILGFMAYAAELRGAPATLHWPLTHPNPDDEFFGYAPADTRLLLKTVLLGATVRVLLATGIRCRSKLDAVRQYGAVFGGETAVWLATLHERCKMQWHYHIPADRAALRALLQPVLAFENEVADVLGDLEIGD